MTFTHCSYSASAFRSDCYFWMDVSVVLSAPRTKSESLIQMFTCVFIHTTLPFSLGCASWRDVWKSEPMAVKKSYTGKLKVCILDVVDNVVLTSKSQALATSWQWDKQVKNSSYLVFIFCPGTVLGHVQRCPILPKKGGMKWKSHFTEDLCFVLHFTIITMHNRGSISISVTVFGKLRSRKLFLTQSELPVPVIWLFFSKSDKNEIRLFFPVLSIQLKRCSYLCR